MEPKEEWIHGFLEEMSPSSMMQGTGLQRPNLPLPQARNGPWLPSFSPLCARARENDEWVEDPFKMGEIAFLSAVVTAVRSMARSCVALVCCKNREEKVVAQLR